MMNSSGRGFTGLEIVTLVVMMGIVAALVFVLMPQPVVHVEIREVRVEAPATAPLTGELVIAPERISITPGEIVFAPKKVTIREPEEMDVASPGQFEAYKLDCLNNMKNLVGLLEVSSMTAYPKYRGPNLILYLVKKGDLVGEDSLRLLFCPGDARESLELCGGVEAYRDIDLKRQGEYDHLTSYAGRNQLLAETAAKKGARTATVLLCDDSADHHDGKGFVVGLSGGAAKWRDKVKDYGLPPETEITVGENSAVVELACLCTD